MSAVEVARAKRARVAIELQRLDDFLAMAEALEKEAAPAAESLSETSAPSRPNGEDGPPSFARLPSIRQRVEESVMAELIKYGGRSTGDLLKTLTAMGIDPAPKANDINNKRNVLSTMLSRAKGRFYNDRAARVWRVKKAVHLLELTKSIDAGEASG